MKRMLGLSLVAVLTSLSLTALADGAATPAAPAKASPKTAGVVKGSAKTSAPAKTSAAAKPGATAAQPKAGPASGGSAKMEGGE